MDKHVLLFKGPQINGAKRNNPCTMDRITQEDYESAFERLDSIGLGACKIKKRRNACKNVKLFPHDFFCISTFDKN